jgi:ADP-heptose:LPS heptosyltransferase
MDIPGLQFLLERYVRYAAARDPVLPLDREMVRSSRRVLVAVTTGMGDLILASPVIESLRKALPNAEVGLFCRTAWAPLFWHDPRVDSVIDYRGKSRRVIRTVKALRNFGPDLVVAPHVNDPDVLPLLYLSGARQIVRVPWGTTRFPELLSNRADAALRESVRGLHVVDERLRAIEALGLPVASRVPRVVPPPHADKVFARAIAATGNAHYAVLHVFSADVYRTIPAKLASDCLRALGQKYPDLGWVLSGSAADRPALEKIAAGAGSNIWIAAGELSIDESAACLSGACAVISPDTGTLHLAAALDRPVLALFSPTREAATREQVVGPRTATAPACVLEVPSVCDPCVGRRCPHRPVKCLQAFQVSDVVAAFEQIIESGLCRK